VPFGGDYRLVDFVLSNLVNGGYLKIVVLTQYKSHSLDRPHRHHLADVAAAGQLRHPGAGADAPRPPLVRPAPPTRSSREHQHGFRSSRYEVSGNRNPCCSHTRRVPSKSTSVP
jgi:hypothetical protein